METAYTGLFAAEDRKFFLPMARIVAAEREMGGISIFEVFSQLGSSLGAIGDEVVLAGPSPATLKQCHTIIMNGLIGGGTDELEAKQLIETYCYPARPAIRDMALTWRILSATIYGIELKKKDDPAEASDTNPSEKASSSSTAQRSASTGKQPRSAPISKPAKPGTKPTTRKPPKKPRQAPQAKASSAS